MEGKNLLPEMSKGRNLLPDYNKPAAPGKVTGTARAALQGLTFGMSDELGGALAALAGSISTGESFGDAYDKIHQNLQGQREAFSDENAGLALGAELAGALGTGAVGGAKLLAGKAFQQLPNAGKVLGISAVGAGEGAVYGAGTADQGERAEGAMSGGAMGAVAAPIGAGIVNALGRAGGGIINYGSAKMAESAGSKAERALRDAANSAGLSGNAIADQVESLGPKATLADVDDQFRVLARAGMNRVGPMRQQGRKLMDARNRGQQSRLLRSIDEEGSPSYGQTLKQITKVRESEAAPMYEAAFAKGVSPETPEMLAAMNNPYIAKAMKKAREAAKADGRQGDWLYILHIAKSETINDRIGGLLRKGARAEARRVIKAKNALLDAIDLQNKEYTKANSVFSDHRSLEDALRLGRDILKGDPEEIKDIVSMMSPGEVELFRLGGIKAIGVKLDKTGENTNAVGKLLNTRDMRQRLALVVDDADSFLKQAGIEDEFAYTRHTLTGNSSTEAQQQMGKALDDGIDGGMARAVASANPETLIAKLVDIVTKNRATPEVIAELGDRMLKQGMSRGEILKIFRQRKVRDALGDRYNEVFAPIVQGGMVPGLSVYQQHSTP